MTTRFIPALFSRYYQTRFTENAELIKQTKSTLDEYDYRLEQQQTPIIYFSKYLPYFEANNYSAICHKMRNVLPQHQLNFWKKDHPLDNIVVDTDKYVSACYSDVLKDVIHRDTLLTRIWYEVEPKRVDVLMERGNFTLDYLMKINYSHRFVSKKN